MTISVVQHDALAQGDAGAPHTDSGTITFSAATAGNLLVVIGANTNSNLQHLHPPAGWTYRTTHEETDNQGALRIIVATKVAAGGETSVTLPVFEGVSDVTGSTARTVLAFFEVSGTWGGWVEDSTSGTTGPSKTLPAITPTAGIEALVVASSVAGNAHALTTPAALYTALDDEATPSGASERINTWYYHVATTSGSYADSFGYAGNLDRWWGVQFWASALGDTTPVAEFTATPRTGNVTLSVDFTDLSDRTPTSWLWDFGDGQTSTSQNPSHDYTDVGTYTVELTATNASGSDSETKVGYIVVSSSGVGIDWDGLSLEDESGRIRSWTVTRGASPELTGGTNPGQATITLINTPDDRYNPENAGGDLYGLLHDGPRVWLGINEDGTITADPDKTVYGLFAGNITEISVLPEAGAAVAPFTEIVCEDPLGWMARQHITLPDSTTRSQADLRRDVLVALDVEHTDLPAEPATLPLSRADGLALNILDELNKANGTRHFAKPADNAGDWYTYTAVRRTSLLDGTSDASVDAGAEHVTGTSGWRISADGVINQQKASVEPIDFPAFIRVWQYDSLPLTVAASTTLTLWLDFGDYVRDSQVDYEATNTPAVMLTSFGDTAKLEITAGSAAVFSSLHVRGYLVERGSTASVVIDDLTSQATSRGVRSGPDLTGDYLGTLTSAHGFATHIVWRFANSLYRPTLTVENWFPTMFTLDLFDRISFTSSQLGVTDRIFEIVGLTHVGDIAAEGAVHHTVTYTLQESRVQTPFGWFILDDSLLDDTDVLAY